ncbi:class B sortase [Eubacteriales bacterium OttesenSCG-928-N13]|nr:class B sortase [Eubacteriales bacterium OttesenSCG-928-N13]
MSKKFIALLLTVMMLVQMLPSFVLADSSLQGSFVSSESDEMHRVTFEGDEGNVLDEFSVKDGTDVTSQADAVAQEQGVTSEWQGVDTNVQMSSINNSVSYMLMGASLTSGDELHEFESVTGVTDGGDMVLNASINLVFDSSDGATQLKSGNIVKATLLLTQATTLSGVIRGYEVFVPLNGAKLQSVPVNASGTPFLDERCDLNSTTDNLLLYGHNMKSGKLFGQLPNYESRSFYQAHKIINFDLVTETRTYEVMGMFRSRQYKDEEEGFKYYNFIDLSNYNRFNEYVDQVKQLSFIDTGVEAHWGDEILTLSTCSYHTGDGTFVVVAKRVS